MLFKKNFPGVSLIEIIVAVAIFGLIAGAVMEIFLRAWASNSIVWEQLSTQSEARKATQDFVSELRVAQQSSSGGYPLMEASSTEIIFYSNVDKDGLVERLRYFVSSSTKTFQRGVIKPSGSPLTYNLASETTTTVAHNVASGTSTVFYYYGANFVSAEAPLTSPVDVTKVRLVRVVLKLDQDPHHFPAPLYVESKAMLRNLKDN